MEESINNKSRTKLLLTLSFIFISLLIIFLLPNSSFGATEDQFKYLSDEDINPISTKVGWDSFRKNQINDGSLISVKVEGAYYSFENGLWAHAASTLVYDLREYNYDYFTAYVGLNQTAGAQSNGVIYKIYTSADGKEWHIKYNEEGKVSKRGEEADFVKIPIKTEKFLKLEAGSNGANGGDHAVYADTKLIKEGYQDPADALVPSISKLDTKIKAFEASGADLSTNGEYELTLLKRELISRTGNYALKKFLAESPDNIAVYKWLTSNLDILRLYVMGGMPDGNNYYNALTILTKLYNEYSDDFKNTKPLGNPTNPKMTYGDLYTKMAMAISLTHSQRVGLWMDSASEENRSEPLRRYAIFKYLHKNGGMRIAESMDMTHTFEDLRVVEMRLVLYNNIDDEEILWLNRYTQDNIDANPGNVWRYQTPHPYIAYVWPNYANPIYFARENESYFNELFAVRKTDNNIGKELVDEKTGEKTGKIGMFDSEFVVPGGKNIKQYKIKIKKGTPDNHVYKVWMNFRNKFGTGCVCGGISKSGANIRGVHGIPAMVVGQPGHAALMFYSKDAEGRGFWRIDNDVSGWTASGGGGRLLRWGSGSYASGFSNGVYIELEQAAVNDYQNLIKAEELVFLAKVYESDLATEATKKVALKKKEDLYREALRIQSINFDAWLGLIDVYKANVSKTEGDGGKTEDDFYNLAEEIAENLKYYPLPMYNATNLIKPNLPSIENTYRFTLLQTRTIKYASTLPNNTETTFTVVQPGVARVEANFLLGQMDQTIATFSFDGEDAGKIVLSSRFDGNGVRWDYSLTGKDGHDNWEDANWKEVTFSAEEEHKLQLTPTELASITAENDIYVHIVGVNYSEENLYKIDITEQSAPSTIYANDWENKVIGATETIEWRYTEKDAWTSYGVASPDLTGNKTVQVRTVATGTKLASAPSEMYTFTADNYPDTRKYIPIEHLSIHSYSTQSTDENRPYYAPNAIDGNITTMWHTDFGQNVLQQPTKPFIAIELDEPRNISALEFVQGKSRDNDPVYIKNAIIYISNDGETWVEVGRLENCEQNLEFKAVEFEESVYGKYIKFEMDTYNMFSSVAMVNLFEDKTKVTLAHFSFNGDDAGKIVLVDEFKGANWEYSLDGGKTWKAETGDSYKLTETELQQINAKYEIKVRVNKKESTINIKEQEAPIISAYVNDLENRLIGINNIDNLEWKIEGNSNWTSYLEKEPIVSGDKKLLIRKKAAGTLMPSDAVEFTFTADNQPDTAKYVSVKHLSIESFSNTTPNRGEEATNAIDALPTTMWHTKRTTTTMKDPRWIVIELDEPRYISKIEYVKKENYVWGILKNGIVSVSMDGENWEVAHNIKDLYNPTTVAELTSSENIKDIVFSKPKQAKYIRIECTESCDYVNGNRNGVPMDYFFSVAMFNIFEDITKVEYPTAEIEYSTTKLTNQDVTATLVNENMDITVTNNGGSKTYTFTDNGKFTFEFINNRGVKGTATAEVHNIDKTMPNASIQYSTTDPTNGNVVATVTFDKQNVTITNNNGNNTHTFTDNGKFTFEFTGPAGNKGTAEATVNWIDRKVPVPTITYSAEYSKEHKTNQDIVATITFNEENVIIKNNGGNNTYTFTDNGKFIFNFEDRAGNTGTATATVANIDKTLPKATITYNIDKLTNQDVVATVTFDKPGVTITNNGGNNTYTFTKNEEFTFEFTGPARNTGIVVAKVDWIDKTAPVPTITYDIDNKLTNKDVTATVTFNEENVTITNNEGSNKYIFTLNGTFTFRFRDMAGNEGIATAQVEWIDKNVPVATITYNINEITNQDVIATVTFNKAGVIIVDENGKEIENGEIYVFTENGTHEFKYRGPAGNEGTAVATVNWIDKIPPAAIINYDIEERTNKDVTATITFDEGGVTIVNEKGEAIENGETYVFTENGTHEFKYIGPLGNIGTATATVTWIDKTAPTATVSYDITEPTYKNVVATLGGESKTIKVTNNNGSKTYTFTKNGTFTFEFEDELGNKGTATATVDWIKEPNNGINSDKYIIDDDDKDISRILPGTTVAKFKENVTTDEKLTFINKEGKELEENSILKTGTVIKVGDKTEYSIVVAGDVDEDGDITVNDIAKIKLHIIDKIKLTGINLKAANVDNDNMGDLINDIARIKFAILGIRAIE